MACVCEMMAHTCRLCHKAINVKSIEGFEDFELLYHTCVLSAFVCPAFARSHFSEYIFFFCSAYPKPQKPGFNEELTQRHTHALIRSHSSQHSRRKSSFTAKQRIIATDEQMKKDPKTNKRLSSVVMCLASIKQFEKCQATKADIQS